MSDYRKLNSIIDAIDALIEKKVTEDSPEFKAWKSNAERFIIKKFGKDSYEHETFKGYSFCLGIYTFETPEHYFIDACKTDLLSVKAIFETYLAEMKEEQTEHQIVEEIKRDCSKVFIVHGHDDVLKLAVARLIEKQNIKAIILHEQANQGATIIEKIESNSDVNAAICLFTADDVCNPENNDKMNNRARQNVVFETGYFMGKLGRDHTIILTDRDVELPSDMQGVVYTDTSNWQFSVLKELKAIGYKIDYNKLD